METFGTYLLKSVCWLTGFAIVYLLFLRNERFFMVKRVYLITGMVISIVFPFISIHYQVELPPADFNSVDLTSPVVSLNTPMQQSMARSFDYRATVLFLYLSGAFFLFYKMVRHIMVLYKTISKVTINSKGPAKLVRASGFPSSFSFFNYIFINPSLSDTEAEEIINHELVHVKQKHWFDLVIIEFLRMMQWMNPFAWIYTGFIRQNHEYLADEAALRCTSNPANYRAALLNQLFNSPVISLSNSLNYSLNKKRFYMMKNIKTSPFRKLKILLVLPVIAIIFYAFATPEYHYNNTPENGKIATRTPVLANKTVKGLVLKEDGTVFGGVPIVVTGTTIRAATDGKGNFTIENVPEGAFLVFSYVGCKTEVVKAQFTDPMTINLLKDPEYKEPTRIRTTSTQPADFRRKNPEDFPTIQGERFTTFRNWVLSRLQYPPEAKARNLEGWVNVNFTIEADGAVGNVKFTGSADPLLGDAVVQMVKSSPKWEPAKNPKVQEPFQSLVAVRFRLPDIVSREEAYVMAETMPRFTGGDAELLKFIAENTQYPEAAKAQGIQGRVIIRFIVNSEGKIEDINVLKSVHPLLDAEAARVVSLITGFVPGYQGGKPVSVYYMVPITFTLKSGPSAALVTQQQRPAPSGREPFVVVEQMPMYPGGDRVLLQHVTERIQYPEGAKSDSIQGRVIVKFAVTRDGNIDNVSVLKGVHPLLDAEAARVVKTLTGWQPGYQGGNPVDVWYMVPVTFTLSSKIPETKQEQQVSPTGEETKSTKDIIVVGYKEGISPAGPLKIQNTDGSPANPLFIIDGKQGDRQMLETIDPNNIESISVLKDESATAVYGEKGRNGVVIVKLKKSVTLQQPVSPSLQ